MKVKEIVSRVKTELREYAFKKYVKRLENATNKDIERLNKRTSAPFHEIIKSGDNEYIGVTNERLQREFEQHDELSRKSRSRERNGECKESK